jgi:phosphatidylglycerol phospholipase C
VRWEVDAILTDTTKTWLDLRDALRCKPWAQLKITHDLTISSADYDKIGSQYGRGFLWTTLWFYTPFVIARGHQAKRYLEKVAGPFDIE